MKGRRMNSLVAGIDLGNRESLTIVLSPIGDVRDRFTFPMNDEGYAYFEEGAEGEAGRRDRSIEEQCDWLFEA